MPLRKLQCFESRHQFGRFGLINFHCILPRVGILFLRPLVSSSASIAAGEAILPELDWGKQQKDKLSRSEAIRRLIEIVCDGQIKNVKTAAAASCFCRFKQSQTWFVTRLIPKTKYMSSPVSTVVTRLAYGVSQLPRVAWYLGHGLALRRLAEAARQREGSQRARRRPHTDAPVPD